jgi:single-strand DNA-binding protein
VANEPILTIVGNLGDDPELRFTPSGQAVCKFRVAQTPRVKQSNGEFADGEPVWMQVTAWRSLAENCAETLRRGNRAIVTGRLKSRTYETREGEKRTVFELEADEVGAGLSFATATIQKVSRNGASSSAPATTRERPAAARPSAETQRAAQAAGDDEAPW